MAESKKTTEPQMACEGYEFSYACPKSYFSLNQSENKSVRYCDECQRKVYFCENATDVALHESMGHCIAVEREIESKSKSVFMGKVDPVPDVSDELILDSQLFTSALDSALSNKLREDGFEGPRSNLHRQGQTFGQHITLVTRAATRTCTVSFAVNFTELTDLCSHFAITTYWQDFPYGSAPFYETARYIAAAVIETQHATLKEMKVINEVLSKPGFNTVTRPMTTQDKIEYYLSDHHLAWLFFRRDNVSLATDLARNTLATFVTRCSRCLEHLERGGITESEFVAQILDDCNSDSDSKLVWGFNGERILELQEVLNALPPSAQKIVKEHEPFDSLFL